MSKELTTTDKKELAEYGQPMHHYGSRTCMEVSKQTFTEIEQIIQQSASYYKNNVILQGVWPDRRIIFRSISIQASQQFDSVAFMQMKNEFRGAFADITMLRDKVAKLEAAARRVVDGGYRGQHSKPLTLVPDDDFEALVEALSDK